MLGEIATEFGPPTVSSPEITDVLKCLELGWRERGAAAGLGWGCVEAFARNLEDGAE